MVETINNEKEKITIGYLMNPDVVYYSELDYKMIDNIKSENVEIIQLQLEEMCFDIQVIEGKHQIKIFNNEGEIKIDGFLSYGYMSPFHYRAYTYIINTLHSIGIPCLHDPQVEYIMNDKYLQYVRYSTNNIPVPQTNIGFSVKSMNNIQQNFYSDFSVSKKLNDYGGDGVFVNKNKEEAVNKVAKMLWNYDYLLFQQLIKDVAGRSIRVLCINGKAIACAEYNDSTGNRLSNISYGNENFKLINLIDSQKYKDYCDLGERTVRSLGDNVTIAGVDILDSAEKGLFVLETNFWPDVYDIAESTKIEVFKLFAQAYCDKVKKAKQNRK